ncbi:MAG: trigger factor family protein [Bacteroidia bacterium]|nr:trigger factor family protein [Bacteroidia bacterium]
MESSIHFPKPYLAEGTIHIPASAYAEAYRHRIRELRRELTLPGFRPGQVPSDVIMGRYGEEVLSQLLADRFMKALKELLGDKQLFQYPLHQRTPETYQVKPPLADYVYTFRALVVAQEALIQKPVSLVRYAYQEAPDDLSIFQRYIQIILGRLEKLEVLPEFFPADRFVLLHLLWKPKEGGIPLQLRWNSFIEPFPWRYLAGHKVGDTFEVPPQVLSSYIEYIRVYYPEYSPITAEETKLTLTAAASAIPLSLEASEEKLHFHENPDFAPQEQWQKLLHHHVHKALRDLNGRLLKNRLLHAADITIPSDIAQYLYILYLASRSQANGERLDYTEFQQELAWELLFQNLVATEPALQVSQAELQETIWENIQKVGDISEESQKFLSLLRESEAARDKFIASLLERNESSLRRGLQLQRLETFLKEKFGEPTEHLLPLKLILLYTL